MIFSRVEALIFVLSLLGLSGAHRAIRPRAPATTQLNSKSNVSNSTSPAYPPDHTDWFYLNGITWWKLDNTQKDHAFFHSLLSMASYGDYESLCPKTFTKGFTVLEKFESDIGQGGFVAFIPEMDKVVIVFRGFEDYKSIDWTPTSIEDLVSDCQGCTVATGIKKLYLSAQAATNNWKVAKQKVAETGVKFSVTGHGMGAAVAATAALVLGSQNYVHYSHHQGGPRFCNYQAAVRYDNLFQVLAGQSLVSENDYMVQMIPLGPSYYHVGTKVKILGDHQQWLINCYGNNENATCIGDGSNKRIHDIYYTPKGQCGSANGPPN